RTVTDLVLRHDFESESRDMPTAVGPPAFDENRTCHVEHSPACRSLYLEVTLTMRAGTSPTTATQRRDSPSSLDKKGERFRRERRRFAWGRRFVQPERVRPRWSTFALRSGTPNSRWQTSASVATPWRIASAEGLAKQSRSRLL